MKQNRLTKLQAERRHFKRRIEQRYGLSLNRKDLYNLSEIIARGLAQLVKQESFRVSVYDVPFKNNRIIRIVYDKMRKSVVTCLTINESGS
jgi:hypothetical protein